MVANRSRRIKKQNSLSPETTGAAVGAGHAHHSKIMGKRANRIPSRSRATLTGTKISTQLRHETRDKYAALKSTTIPSRSQLHPVQNKSYLLYPAPSSFICPLICFDLIAVLFLILIQKKN